MDEATPRPRQRKGWVRYLLLGLGWLSVALGIIGAFLPLLPTTPFLLLAAACFMRSSERFYLWLINHRWLGPWVKPYLEGDGIPLKGKIYAIVAMWISVGFSCWLVPYVWARVAAFTSCAAVTVYLLKQKTRR
ncbi:YbaN family protein [Pseudomonas benzopyrenica]|uniref:YbaN family protein n=1 Tax=Pseudomonas benzopyrenica TaxID=2993566 RepID=UPI0039C246FB